MAKKKAKRGRPPKENPLVLISFRIAPNLYDQLEQDAKGKFDDSGLPLTATQLARQILVHALKKR